MAKAAQCPIEKEMLRAGRDYLSANPKASADDYKVKQVMAIAAPTHNAAQQVKVLNVLKREFRKR